MIKRMTPLLFTVLLLADNAPSLNEQLHAIDAAQADMFSDFDKIKKKREIEERKAEAIEEKREKEARVKKAEEKRIAAEKLKKDEAKRIEMAHQNALKKIADDKKKAEDLKRKKALEEKSLQASKLAEAKRLKAKKQLQETKRKQLAAKKKTDIKKRAAAKRRALKNKKKHALTHKVEVKAVTTAKEPSSLETLNALLNQNE